jgi:hypothetical protein
MRTRLAALSLPAQAAWASALVFGLWLVAAPTSYQISGASGPRAAATGAGVCLLGAWLALAISALFPGPSGAMHRMLFSMLARTMIPLLLGVALHLNAPSLAAAGMIFYLLIFYVATLVFDTALLLAQVGNTPAVQSSQTSDKPI